MRIKQFILSKLLDIIKLNIKLYERKHSAIRNAITEERKEELTLELQKQGKYLINLASFYNRFAGDGAGISLKDHIKRDGFSYPYFHTHNQKGDYYNDMMFI